MDFDTVRRVITLLLFLLLPAAISFWLIVHPFIRFWRRMGPGITYAVATGTMIAVSLSLYQVRQPVLARDFGTSWWLVGLGVVLLVVSGAIARRRGRHLTKWILVGVPEVAPAKHPPKLLTEGIYSKVRHPRYVEFILGTAGWVLIANHLAGYWVLGGTILGILLVVFLEERELLDRFGDEYRAYQAEVPRFIPRRGGPR